MASPMCASENGFAVCGGEAGLVARHPDAEAGALVFGHAGREDEAGAGVPRSRNATFDRMFGSLGLADGIMPDVRANLEGGDVRTTPAVGTVPTALLLALLVSGVATAQAPDDRGFDPTGVWFGMHGPLALMRAGDTLTFSYSAVFGATAQTCDGIGVAGFVSPPHSRPSRGRATS